MKRVLAVDGGNSKTDLALVSEVGEIVGFARGPASSPHHVGADGTVEIVAALLEDALGEPASGRVADVAELLMAGVDFAAEETEAARASSRSAAGPSEIFVGNDTFAVLRAGTERGWGVAVVCGAGINCIGVAPDGRHARFPALGPTTGDWGGGYDVGLAATSAAARSEDGRGPRTSLERLVPAHFGVETPSRLAEEIHRGHIPLRRLEELPPVVFSAAADDAVAAAILDRLASEVVALARVALQRLELRSSPRRSCWEAASSRRATAAYSPRSKPASGRSAPSSRCAEPLRRRSWERLCSGSMRSAQRPEALARAREEIGEAAQNAERMSIG